MGPVRSVSVFATGVEGIVLAFSTKSPSKALVEVLEVAFDQAPIAWNVVIVVSKEHEHALVVSGL